jgi:pyruvate, orthophosphate dikinase
VPYVFAFDHDHDEPPRSLKDLLGGKGANLAEMTSVLGLPVPPGFTITTDACRAYLDAGWPDGLDEEVAEHLQRLEAAMGKRLGDAEDPLLVSVRSGAAASMPGMMDTVLNLGLTDESVRGLAEQTDDERFALDSYRRFIMMFSRIVLGVAGEGKEKDPFDDAYEEAKRSAGVEDDAGLGPDELRHVVERFQQIVVERTGEPFPQDPAVQLRRAVEAVFSSWNAPRATAYRNREHLPHDMGTAVNVQAMVFGNMGDTSGTGVGFTRDPNTGEQGAYGDFLVNAQGEDVVAGIRATEPLAALGERFPDIFEELLGIFSRLERHYREMLDTEFTIERGKLWMLQTRVGKRTGVAALQMAVDMVGEDDIALSREEAVQRITAAHLDSVLHPQFAPGEEPQVLTTGLAASPGAAVGKAYFTAEDAIAAVDRGEEVILVRDETSPDDVHGMAVAEGVLTARGGLVSHAAVVARGWGKPAVCGAREIAIDGDSFSVGDQTVQEGDVISIDGTTGKVVLGEVALTSGEMPPAMETLLGWADEIRSGGLAVRANADTAEDAVRARELGAEGIGLCRTEHMFLTDDRLPVMRRMILAEGGDEEQAALDELREAQRSDFVGVLEAMDGLPVTVRLLDPPLHEFLPDVSDLEVGDATGDLSDTDRQLLDAARSWQEVNPMLGTRGIRLGVVRPGLYTMQVRALLEAVADRRAAGGHPIVEIMVPLTVAREELTLARRWVDEAIADTVGDAGGAVSLGTMIEVPRAALRAGDLAEEAEFFSFGTNDLTQMTLAFSRDDVEGEVMKRYLAEGLLARNPFETIDIEGVGELVRMAATRGRETRPDLKLGVCGEHGGDPESIAFFAEVGLDYVSCSPFRVPIARLAAAHAVLASDAAR